MSHRIAVTLEVLRHIRKDYHKSPHISIKHHRLNARDEIADDYKKMGPNTVHDHLVMGHQGPDKIKASEMDRLLKDWLTEGSSELAQRYLRNAVGIDKTKLEQFFAEELGQKPVIGKLLKDDPEDIAQEIRRSKYGTAGETEEHRRLKESIASNPAIVGLDITLAPGVNEYGFRSQDAVDVLFISEKQWVGIEVKSKISNVDDIERGIYQCIKYQALIEATQKVKNIQATSKVILALEAQFPSKLISLRDTLGIHVIDCINPGK